MNLLRNGLFAALAALLLAGCDLGAGKGGEIHVGSAPEGAEIYLNGTKAGETPKRIVHLAPGAYTVELRKQGYERAYQTIALLEGREVDMDLELKQIVGLLLVTSDPAGSEVVIDHEVKGTTPALITELPLGEYPVVVRTAGLPERKATVVLADRKPVKLEVKHAPRVAVNSYPPGAEILVDGELKGIAPLVLEDVPTGSHQLLAQLDQYDSQEQSILLMPGLNDAVEFNLEKNSGTLLIDTEPAQVQVYVNGTLFATTQPKEGADSISQPLRIALKAGIDHKIQLVREGYTSTSLTVQTAVDQVVTQHKMLRRIFVYDTRITTKEEVIDCRLEYKLPNGNYYYERYPGVYNTAKAANILNVEKITLDDDRNEAARRLIEQSKQSMEGL
ncbi:PEGA domain-containing protein [Pontiella desulfatans]|nr:PEGA domain-containing protein [Pontiella desulfatans]